MIRIDGDRLGLTEEPDLSIDIRDFERLIGEADQALGSSIPSRALAKLLEAIGSTEDVLLRDRNVGDWATPFRERWRDDIVSACARAAALLAASGDAQPGLQIARRALTLDAGSQIAWCAEIDARLHLGDRRGAREAARRCESELMRRGVTIDGITKEAFSRSGAGRNSSARSL